MHIVINGQRVRLNLDFKQINAMHSVQTNKHNVPFYWVKLSMRFKNKFVLMIVFRIWILPQSDGKYLSMRLLISARWLRKKVFKFYLIYIEIPKVVGQHSPLAAVSNHSRHLKFMTEFLVTYDGDGQLDAKKRESRRTQRSTETADSQPINVCIEWTGIE